MQIHQLKPKHGLKSKKRVGRGGKKGTYSGKGIKGQKSRAGRKIVPIVREIIKRYPKLRGYKGFVLQKDQALVSIDILEKKFKEGDTVSPETLVEKGIIRTIKGKTPKVKILGKEKLSKKLTVQNCAVSKTAKEVLEKAGAIIK